MSVEPDRWTEIRKIHVESADAYRIVGGIVLVGLGIWIGSLIFADDKGYGTNLYTELISIGVTVFILDFLNRRRDERRRIEDLKARLLRDIRSSENSVAKHAAHELSEYGWLTGETGLLQGAELRYANLQGAHLRGANLHGADLVYAKLQRAELWDANLQGANLEQANLQGTYLVRTHLQGAHLKRALMQGAQLWNANLQGAGLEEANLQGANLMDTNLQEAKLQEANLERAHLEHANLQGAYLMYTHLQGVYLLEANLRVAKLEGANLQEAKLAGANLQGADLKEGNLKGANLWEANLQGVNLKYTKFDEQTWLPDGTFWQPDVDLTRFTDPNHPEFWRSGEEKSPAYRGKEDTSS